MAFCRNVMMMRSTARIATSNGSCSSTQESSFGIFLRRFSAQSPDAAEQKNLIKQLRERTSAPINKVKASLVDCNWDIEAAQKDLRKRGIILASKKSARTATEGLLALAHTEGKAAIIELNCETDFVARNEALQRVGSELAMHVVAAKPLFLNKELVSSEAVESEREILKYRAENTGKSQMAIDKMVEGRMRKYFEEVVLMEQKFIVNDTLNVKTLLNNLSEEVGSPVKIGNFFRMEVGEGIQRLDASADEPVAQTA
ncbi:Elongation factor Ts, mitochondrial [Linum perenne]